MKKKEMILWLLLIVIIIFLIFFLFIIVNNSKQDKTVELNDILFEENIWGLSDVYFYDSNGTQKLVNHVYFDLKFNEEYLKICNDIECKNIKYSLNDGLLVIEENCELIGEYNVYYNSNKLIFENIWDNGNKLIYNFVIPEG